jgi:peptidoglycan/LPS O-acetylase OafA/YrhL
LSDNISLDQAVLLKVKDITVGKRFLALDGLRGTAAISVVIWHANQRIGNSTWLPSGYLAVDLFFILSGFVLAYAYDRRFAGGMTAFEFARIRVIRLYPLYILGMVLPIITTFWSWATGHIGFASPRLFAFALPANLLMLPVPPCCVRATFLFPLNAPAWSLFFELLINIAFASTWRWLSIRVVILICVTAAIFLICVDYQYRGLSDGWGWSSFTVGTARVFFSFPLGVLIFRATRSWTHVRVSPLLLCLLLIFLLWVPAPNGGKRFLYDLLCVTVALPLVVILASLVDVSAKWTAAFSFLGKTSYAIYAIHWPAIFVASILIDSMPGASLAIGSTSLIVALVAALVATAWLADKLYDDPIRRWLSEKREKPMNRPQPQAVVR